MNSDDAWAEMLRFEKLGLLKFRTIQHRAVFKSHMVWMKEISRDILIEILKNSLSDRDGFVGLCIFSSIPGIHFSRTFDLWKVAGWIELRKSSINLHLLREVDYSKSGLFLVNENRKGTPHPLILKCTKIKQAQEIQMLLSRSEENIDW
jgi:hypothetical protein